MCVWRSICTCVQGPAEARRRHWVPRSCNHRWFVSYPEQVLGTKPGSSTRTAPALTC